MRTLLLNLALACRSVRWLPAFLTGLGIVAGLPLAALRAAPVTAPLTRLEYRVTGSALAVSPAVLSVPKGLAGSLAVELIGDPALAQQAYVSAILRGPGIEARELIAAPGQPLLLPPLQLVGDYQLDQIRLVDATTQATRLEGTPGSVPVRVFDEVLVSRVTSRPLSLDEIRERGIAIDASNFRAVEFEVGLVLDGRTVPVKFPVVAPKFSQASELIPAAELVARLAEAEQANRDLAGTLVLPAELQHARLNLDFQAVNFQFAENQDEDLALKIPPIPALLLIPGNIGFLNQFFSVQVFTENAAPAGSGLSAVNLQAELVLPPGPDAVPAVDHARPGDDPLRFARVGPDRVVQPVQTIVRPGPDGQLGTADDIGRLQPGESGQAEFLVEGLQEGLHVLNLKLTADLDGLAAGRVRITGKAAGSVLVRNPKFSFAFTHPRTVRVGEPYEVSVTILNTGDVPANLVSVTLPAASISGARLETPGTVTLGSLPPGQTATARYRLRAQRTGSVVFSNLGTSSDNTLGSFRFGVGVDERGVPLSPDDIALPEYTGDLPPAILAAAQRVLGQALSVATAPVLPAGVLRSDRQTVKARVIELAEAGQRLRYGDTAERVLADLALDWQGARLLDAGFDQGLRVTEAGREWREALATALAAAVPGQDAVARLGRGAADLAGRGEPWLLVADNLTAEVATPVYRHGTNELSTARSGVPQGAGYAGPGGQWLALRPVTAGIVEWHFTQAVERVAFGWVQVAAEGTGSRLEWSLTGVPVGARVRLDLAAVPPVLRLDPAGDGSDLETVGATATPVRELPPRVLGVVQDLAVDAGRPGRVCLLPEVRNYGTVVAVQFSKPMTQAGVDLPANYRLTGAGRELVANSVQIQPGSRVALVNVSQPISAIRPRELTVRGVTDPRGQPVTDEPVAIRSEFRGQPFRQGVALRGRVVRADGSPAAGIPVTLTMEDQISTDSGCDPFLVRVAQQSSDADGFFDFDFVLSGIPYAVSATDTAGLSSEALAVLLAGTGASADLRAQLEQASAANADSILAAFASTSLPQAIARAEGLDRAVVRDLVPVGSGREGTETPVALRFRGRGTVTGVVLASDGQTPLPNVAVNLYPDPASRELGRGVFSDRDGRFGFFGVPLGQFGVQADNGGGLTRTLSGELRTPGQSLELSVVLAAATMARATVQGTVTEADHQTPHAGASLYVGRFEGGRMVNVVASVMANGEGRWTAARVPVGTWDVLALSQDGRRRGVRLAVGVSAGVENGVTVALGGVADVVGRVETPGGQPVQGALVTAAGQVVTSDAQGQFLIPGVATGRRTVTAGARRTTDPAHPATVPPFDFPRLGSAEVEVVAGVDNFVVIRFAPAGRITGRVLDEAGRPVPFVGVAHPQENGFSYVTTDARGVYQFENFSLGGYTLSAPAGPTAATDVSQIQSTLRDPESGQQELEAALGKAFATFTGVNDPWLNGSGATFNPAGWGFVETGLSFDGQTAVADIHYRPRGGLSGRTVNGQGIGIGSKVRLTGIAPAANGAPVLRIRGELNSDPGTGEFAFPGALFLGPWGLQAANPFFNVIPTAAGALTELEREVRDVVLEFPVTREANGRLAGMVEQQDGTSVAAGVRVAINLSADYVIETRDDGTFDTAAFNLPPRRYVVTVTDPVTARVGQGVVDIQAGLTTGITVRLLETGRARVRVVAANGQPVTGAQVAVVGGAFPNSRAQGVTGADGVVELDGLFAGPYAAEANAVAGVSRIFGRTGFAVPAGVTTEVTVSLQPTATLRGQFVQLDRVTPVAAAQVRIGEVGFATTGADGRFEVQGLPLGRYRLLSSDPVTGAGAVGQVDVVRDGEVVNVVLVEQARAEIFGAVIDGYGQAPVAGAEVSLTVGDGITPGRSVTAGPDGVFSFPGVPAGTFRLSARDPASGWSGARDGTLPDSATRIEVNVGLQPLAVLAGTVRNPDGTPATQATVVLAGADLVRSRETDAQGRVEFLDLPLGSYEVEAADRVRPRSVARTLASVNAAGPAPEFALQLGGTGELVGTILASDGVTPAGGAEVHLEAASPVPGIRLEGEVKLADAAGRFRFEGVAVGVNALSARLGALAGGATAVLTRDGESAEVRITLAASGAVAGRLVRADGVTPIAQADVSLAFNGPRLSFRTAADGRFRFEGIPLGPVRVESVVPAVQGLARADGILTANGGVLDLGDVHLDEADPRVVLVTPGSESVGVATTTPVDLEFSEPLDPATLTGGGILLRQAGAPVPVQLELRALPGETGLRLVRLTPVERLRSLARYEVVVVRDLRSAVGAVTATGPRDLVGRGLTTIFTSGFTTADNDPPRLVSLAPAADEASVDPRIIPRLSFSEPLKEGVSLELVAPDGPVPGRVTLSQGNTVLTFTPAALLPPNTVFTLRIDQVRDLAGNPAAGLPWVSRFTTIDTVGPEVVSLEPVGAVVPVAGRTITVEARLAAEEAGASVRFLTDATPLAEVTAPPFRTSLVLPASGAVTIRAIASDRFGNQGALKSLRIETVPNQPPVVQLARSNPASGTLASGQSFSVRVSATDDVAVAALTVDSPDVPGFTASLPDGAQRTLSLGVPADTAPGTVLRLVARATDSLGLTSETPPLELTITDGTAPTVAIQSPAADALLDPEEALRLVVNVADNSPAYRLEVALAGALAGDATREVQAPPGTATAQEFGLPLTGALLDGRSLLVQVKAIDAAGNQQVATRTYRLPDRVAPTVVRLTPADQATGVGLAAELSVGFSEPVDPESLLGGAVTLRRDVEGTQVAGALVPAADGRSVEFRPEIPLEPSTRYRWTVTTAVKDRAGNPLAAEVVGVFEVGEFFLTSPTEGQRVIEGQNLALRTAFTRPQGEDAVRITAAGQVQVARPASALVTWVVPTLATLGTNRLGFLAEALAGEVVLATARSTVTVFPAAGDEDRDGLLNGYEAAQGLDPFFDEAGGDLDDDGLTNFQESQLGTDLRNPDTDGDGLWDGEERVVGSDPKVADTDGDGLPDGSDPQPTQLRPGLEWQVATEVVLAEGGSSNLVLRVISPEAPLALVDYQPGTRPPPFITLSAPEFTAAGEGGEAVAVLALNPLHDAAGQYPVTLRAVARDGRSGFIQVTVTVTESPALTATHWKEPVNGSWSDPARWTAGVPGAGQVAVIDAAGAYTVTVGGEVNPVGVVLAGPEAVLASANATFNAPVELRAGALVVNANTTLTLNRPLANRGRIQCYSRDVSTTLTGTGFVENQGELRNLPWGGGCCGFAFLKVPVHTLATGRVVATGGSQMLWQSGGVPVFAGVLEIQPSGFMALADDGVARDLTLLAGSRVTGRGLLRFHGQNRFVVAGDASLEPLVEFADQSRSAGRGILTLKGGQTLNGTFETPLVVDRGVTVSTANVRLSTGASLWVRAGATLVVNAHTTLTLDAGMTNEGTLHLYSRDVNTAIAGTGWIHNPGLVQVNPWGGGCCGYARVRVPIHTPATGRFRVQTGAQLSWEAGGVPSFDGALELDGFAVMSEDGPARALTLGEGSRGVGVGLLRFHGDNRLVVNGAATWAPRLELQNRSRQSGSGLLTLLGGQTLTGGYDGQVTLAAGGDFAFSGASVGTTGRLTVEMGAKVSVNANTALTVDGFLINQGILRLYSRDVNTTLDGAGLLENEGLLEVNQWGGGCCGYARINLRHHTASGGRLAVVGGAQLSWEMGGLPEVDGVLEVNGFAVMSQVGPARDLVVGEGGRITGTGLLRFHGENRLVLRVEVPVSPGLDLLDAARVVGPGRLVLGGGQVLTGTFEAPLALAPDVTVSVSGARIQSSLTVPAGATLVVNANQSLQIDGVLTNRGTVQIYSRDVNTYLVGQGRVENEGLLRVDPWGGGCCGYAVVALPVAVPAGGRILVQPGAQVRWPEGGVPTVAGTWEIQGFAVIENGGPVREVVLLEGARLTGGGILRIHGAHRLRLAGAAELQTQLELKDQSATAGDGLLTLLGNQALTGRYGSPTALAAGAAVTLNSPVFTRPLTILTGAVVAVGANQSATFEAPVTNQGTLHLYSRDVSTSLNGVGPFVNEGLLQVNPWGGGCCGFARIDLPVEVPASGEVRVQGGAQTRVAAGTFEVAGRLHVDGYLALEAQAEGQELRLLEGAVVSGAGEVRLEGANRLVAAGDATLGGALLQLLGDSRLVGDATLTVGLGATLRLDHSLTFPGDLRVLGTLQVPSAGATVQIAGELTLEPGGTLNNAGTVRVGSWTDLGGVVVGNPPLVGLSPGGFTLRLIFGAPVAPVPADSPRLAALEVARWQVVGEGPPGRRLEVEQSVDLRHWHRIPAAVTEVTPGHYRIDLGVGELPQGFLRLVVPGN